MPAETKAPGETAVATPERPDLESKIAEQFAAAFADVNESDLIDDETPETTETPAEKDDEPAPDAQAKDEPGATEEPAAEAEDDKEQTTTEEAAAPAAPTLPAAYRRTLKAYEWSDDEIDSNLKAFGPKFIETAAKMHANRNKEVSAWADAGRKAREGTAAAPNKDASQTPAPETAMKPIDADALKKQYGEEALIDAIVAPVNRAIEQINQMMPVAQQFRTSLQQQQMETLAKQIDGFFSDKEMVPYKDMYGTAYASLSNEQAEARTKVLELADALIGGAKLQGRSLPLNDAMQMAFDSLSGETKVQAARKEITKQLQTRNKGITLKPSSKARPISGSPAKSRSDLEKRVATTLATAFNR
jgi:hypothetical protein